MKKILMSFFTICLAFLMIFSAQNALQKEEKCLADSLPNLTSEKESEATAYLSVIGEASIKARPDKAKIYGSIQKLNMDIKQAKDECSKDFEALTNALSSENLKVSMTSFSCYPSYDYSSFRELVGYYASINFTVDVSDLAQIGEVVDGIIGYDGAKVSSINYMVSNQDELYASALSSALENAKQKAKNIMGTEPKIVGICEECSYNYFTTYRSVNELSSAFDMAEDIEITAKVIVKFEM